MSALARTLDDEALARVADLLDWWGELVREEPHPGRLGYPTETIEARAQRDHAMRSESKLSKAVSHWVPRWVDMGNGRRARRRVMAPDPVHKQTGGKAPQETRPWPDRIWEVERIIGQMPKRRRELLFSRHLYRHSIRVGANYIGTSMGSYRRELDRAYEYIAERLSVVGPETD